MNINLKLMMGINVKPKTIKILEENTEVNLSEFGLGEVFLDTIPKAQEVKKQTNK